MGALIGGGFTPLFAVSGSPSSTPLAVLAGACGLVTLLAIWWTSETGGRDLAAEVKTRTPVSN